MSQAGAYTDPAVEIRAITASDSTDLTGCRGFFYTGTSGDVAVKTKYGASKTTAVTISDCPANVVFAIQLTRIMATGTTATQIYGLF